MKLRLHLIALSFIFIATSAAAQDYKENIKTDFDAYTSALVDKDFVSALDYMIPEFFTIVTKNQLLEVMKMIYSNPEIEFVMNDAKILEIGDQEEIEDDFYSILSYSTTIDMKFNLGDTDTEEDKLMQDALIKENLDKTFGEENVSYNNETNFFSIYSVKPVCAKSTNGLDTWKFAVVEEDQKAILQMILPQEIMDKI